MIKIFEVGKIKEEEIFARNEPVAEVGGIVSEIINNVKTKGDKALSEYLEKFDIPLEAMNTIENIKAATVDVMKSASAEGVRYIEIRFAPLLSVSDSMKTGDVIEAVIAGLNEGRKLFNIHGNAICCAMTHHDIEESKAMFKVAREYYL